MVQGSRNGKLARFATLVTCWLAAEPCFLVVVGLLAIQAVWFVFTARYPMAFDEDFHFGLIQLHAQQWLPFFTSQPPHSAQFGAIARDPSYLYHFLMSFPYRLLTLASRNMVFQIIILRLINVALSLYALVLARRVLFKLHVSRSLTHASLLLFVLVPIVPFLAAQINYDNLFIPLTFWALLATFAWIEECKAGHISAVKSVCMLSIFGLACLVKYAFLPIAAMLVGVMLWELAKRRHNWPALGDSMLHSLRSVPRWQLAACVLLLAVSTGLFAERYAVNLQLYHTPNPDCGQVLTIPDCLSYGPWARDYTLKENKPADKHPSKIAYLWEWPYGIWLRSFFAISDTYDTQPPLPIPGTTVIVVAAVGTLLFIHYARQLLRHSINRRIVVLALTLYMAALVAQTFQAYLATGQPVAINGRYILPFLPAVITLVGLAYRELWRWHPATKAVAAALAVLLFLPGGTGTFLMRSTDSWFWPNAAVTAINHDIRSTFSPIVLGSGHF